MAGLNNFKFLFRSNEKSTTNHYKYTVQEALKASKPAEELIQLKGTMKKMIKRVPIVKENESGKKGKNQAVREKPEIERKQEVSSMENLAIQGKEEGMLQDIKAENLPLREAIILSEIIGAPRCKSRFRRRG